MRIGIAVVVLLSMVFASPSAHARSFRSVGKIRPWLATHGSPATYSMSDVNSDIKNVNAQSGAQMDEVHGGLGAGAALGFELPSRLASRFSVGVGYDRLSASSEWGDASGSVKYDLPANALRAFGQYAFVRVGESGAYVAGSLGRVNSAGSATVTSTGSGSLKQDIKGYGGLFELVAGGDWWTTSQFALSSSVGYRYAKIGETTMNGNTVYLPNGEKESIDYSGVVARAGIKFALAK